MSSTPYESGDLVLRLYEQRREPLMREARDWVLRSFRPATADDVLATLASPRGAHYRMVVGYWDMAAALVVHGAIQAELFRDAHPEMYATFALVAPVLDDLRTRIGDPDYLRSFERVVRRTPGVEARLRRLHEQLFAHAETDDEA
jgi:hypothetical protein